MNPRNNSFATVLRIALLALLISCTTRFGFPQNVNAGDIRGTVTDTSGAVMPGVKILIRNTQTGVTKELITNDAGIYDAVSILPGEYSLTFIREGFNRLVHEGVVLHAEVIDVNAELSVGTALQEVKVTAQAAPLQTETAEHSSIVDAEAIAQLPNVGNDWTNYMREMPGVVGSGSNISVNGTEPHQQNWLQDGGRSSLPQSIWVETGHVMETVAEAKVSTALFDAQYGTGVAVVNRLSKSGTNQFHGAAYDYVENNFFNARNFFSQKVANQRYSEWGGAVGGPIKRDKLFFYFNRDGTHNNAASPTFYTFPTAAMRAGDFSGSSFPVVYDPATLANGVRQPFPGNIIPANRFDPVAMNIQNYLPAPNLGGVTNNYYAQQVAKSPYTNYFGRMDYNISAANRLSGTVRDELATLFGPDPRCPMNCTNSWYYDLESQITDVWTLSPTMVNEFRVSYARENNYVLPPNMGQGYPQKIGLEYGVADIFPVISIAGPVGSTSISGGSYALKIDGSWLPSDVFTMIRGRHILKFGGEFPLDYDNPGRSGQIQSASLSFTGLFTARAPNGTGLGYGDFLTGQVQSWSVKDTLPFGLRMKSQEFFVQDDYKIRPNLTINLGLRIEMRAGWSEMHNRLSAFDPTLMNPATNTLGAMWFAPNNGRSAMQAAVHDIFLPRVGFAWSPKSKWSVRGGFGMYAQMWSGDIYSGNNAAVGYSTTGSMSTTDGQTPVFTLSSPNPPLNLFVPSASTLLPQTLNGQAVYYFPYHTPVARIYEGSLAIQRELGRGLVAEVSYVGNYANNLTNPRDMNQVPESLLGPGNAQPRRPYSQFLTVTADPYDAFSNYNGLQLAVRKQFARAFSFDLNYTWSKNLDIQDGSGWAGHAGVTNTTQAWQNAYTPDTNYGLSNNDIAQTFHGYVVYELPVGKGKALLSQGGLLDAIVGGWRLSSLFVVQTGSPFTPVMGTNQSGALSGSWYPNRIANGALPDPTIHGWFDTTAFVQPPTYTFGNSGRNVVFGPEMSDIDFSMGKSFVIPKLGEGGRLQLRVDATNIINHPSFSIPSAAIGNAGVGVITSTTVGGRTLQLGARLAF